MCGLTPFALFLRTRLTSRSRKYPTTVRCSRAHTNPDSSPVTMTCAEQCFSHLLSKSGSESDGMSRRTLARWHVGLWHEGEVNGCLLPRRLSGVNRKCFERD